MNKTTLLLLLVISMVMIDTNAQNPNISFGIKGGANYATYTPKYPIPEIKDIYYSSLMGFYVGGFVNFEISKKFKIQPELVFARQGSKSSNDNVELRIDDMILLNDFKSNIYEYTLILPIVAQYYFTDKFYGEAGPQIGYIVDKKDKFTENYFGTDDKVPEFDYERFDFGFSLGVGFKISEKIGINTRYFFGLLEKKSSVFNLGLEYHL